MNPALVILAAALLCGCVGPPRSVSEPEGVRIVRDLTYATVGDEELQLDLYLPEDYSSPLPIVMWIHGGGWVTGSRSPCPVARLATHGYAVASVSYRLAQGETVFPAPLHDCKAAVRWLRANAWRFGCDGARIGAWGPSAGGHLAALLGTVQGDPALEGNLGVTGISSRVQCVVAFFPVTDLARLEQVEDEHWRINLVAKALLHGSPRAKPELAAAASPITHVARDSAPMLLIHGMADGVTPHEQSSRMQAALEAAGATSRLMLIEGMPHGNHVLAREDLRAAVHAWFAAHLAPSTTAAGGL